MGQLPLRRSLLTLCALTTLALPALAHAQFEGVLTVKITGANRTMDATYSVKGDKLRMDMTMGSMGGVAMITDKAAEKSYMLMPQRQMYMETDLDGAMAKAQQSGSEGQFTWDGTSETIAGTKCDDATAKDADGATFHMCIAKGIAFYGRPGRMGRRAGSAWQQHVQGGFPLKVQREGDSTAIFEVTKVEQKSLPDDLFTPPAGWQKMSMPMGMGMPMRRP